MIDRTNWQQVHDALVSLSKRKAGLEYEELVLLLAAERTRAWHRIGYGSMVEYADRVAGIDGHTLAEKLRTAGKLETLPLLSDAMRDGRVCYSGARELTRIVTPETEGEWIQEAHGKTVRELVNRMRVHAEGDRPGDPPKPDLARRVLRFELDTEAWALVTEALRREKSDLGSGATEEQALASLIHRSRRPADDGVAPAQVAYTICESCERAWVDTKNERVEVRPECGERAACDANVVPAATEKRAAQTIRPSVRRAAIRRAGGRCEVPGCRCSHWNELHHVDLKSEGGSHELENLVVTCQRHHDWLHEGRITVERRPDGKVLVRHADGTVYGEAPRPAEIDAAVDAFTALRQLKFQEGEARQVLAEIRAELVALPLEKLLGEALKRLGKRRSYLLQDSRAGMAREREATYGVSRETRRTLRSNAGSRWKPDTVRMRASAA